MFGVTEEHPKTFQMMFSIIVLQESGRGRKKSMETGKSIRQICIEMNLFSGKELDNILDFRKLTRPGVAKKGK